MANSASHLLGQMIGNIFEMAVHSYLQPIAQEYNLYLDFRHSRIARGGHSEVVWPDINGNNHKLDFVFERGGDEAHFGEPIAFVETAWRKYTKHSKNKVQEISGAILPLVREHHRNLPFYGAILAGVFTENSIQQLRSEGFRVVYFQLPTIEHAFAQVGVDAHWEEDTPEDILWDKANQVKQLDNAQIANIISNLLANNSNELRPFYLSLRQCLERQVMSICIHPLFGSIVEFRNVDEACNFILSIENVSFNAPLTRFEILIKFNNNEEISMCFNDRSHAIAYLRCFV